MVGRGRRRWRRRWRRRRRRWRWRWQRPPGGGGPLLGSPGCVATAAPCSCEYKVCCDVSLQFRERSAHGRMFGVHSFRGAFKSRGRARRRTPFTGSRETTYPEGIGTRLRAVVRQGCEGGVPHPCSNSAHSRCFHICLFLAFWCFHGNHLPHHSALLAERGFFVVLICWHDCWGVVVYFLAKLVLRPAPARPADADGSARAMGSGGPWYMLFRENK